MQISSFMWSRAMTLHTSKVDPIYMQLVTMASRYQQLIHEYYVLTSNNKIL